jgi:hypothetical protein
MIIFDKNPKNTHVYPFLFFFFLLFDNAQKISLNPVWHTSKPRLTNSKRVSSYLNPIRPNRSHSFCATFKQTLIEIHSPIN